jgi:hypothetical protein
VPFRANGNVRRVAGGDVLTRVRVICMALPGVIERESHGAPAFFAGKQFVHLWPSGHHDRVVPHLWCAAPTGEQEALIAADPARFFRPPYVGSRGWVGLVLDGDVDWGEVAELCAEAHRCVTERPRSRYRE